MYRLILARPVTSLLAVVAILFFSSSASADVSPTPDYSIRGPQEWLSVAPDGTLRKEAGERADQPAVRVEESTAEGMTLEFSLPGLRLTDMTSKEGEFVSLAIPGHGITSEVGEPAIPVIRKLFEAPDGVTVEADWQILSRSRLTERLAARRLRVFPVQPPVEKLRGAIEKARFRINTEVYGRDALLPADRVRLQEVGVVKGRRLLLLEVFPIAYNPVAELVEVYPRIVVNISFKGDNADAGVLIGEEPDSDGEPATGSFMEGDTKSGNYLIIVDDGFASTIAGFASTKTSLGYTVTVATTSVAGSTTTAIKSYIQGQYDNVSTRPDYVLLVGDTNLIPNWVGLGTDSPATDLYYATMDAGDDWLPDIAIGRFPARTTGQLDAMIDKTEYVEADTFSDRTWLSEAVFMASEDNYTVSEGTHNYVISTYLDPAGFTSDKLYCHTYSATTQQVRNAFNDGRIFGVYSGHGSTTVWADGPYFSQSDINGLSNGNMYPFVASFACLTGTYTILECFAETWVRAADKGAAAIWASSVNSYWTEDDVLEKKLFAAIYSSGEREVGNAVHEAKLLYLSTMGSGSTTRRYFEMYNLMGDPSLAIPESQTPGSPEICMSTTSLDNSCRSGENAPNQSFEIWNCGGDLLEYSISDNQGWLSCAPTSGTSTGEHDLVTVYYATSGLAPGDYWATITVSDPDAGNSPQEIDVHLTVTGLTITSPGGGEKCAPGDNFPIAWDSFGSVGSTVKIVLRKSGENVLIITTETSNDGTYDWQVPGGLPDGDDYQIKLKSKLDSSIVDYSEYFTVESGTTPATITVLSPNGGEVFDVGDPCAITWTSEGAGSSVKIILYKNGAKLFTIVRETSNDGSYDWNIPGDLTPDDDYQIRIKSRSVDDVDDVSDGYFEVQNGTPPPPASITVTYPNGGEVFNVGNPCTITWTSESAGSLVKIILYKNGAKLFTIVKETSNDGSYDWNIPGDLALDDDYQIRIKSRSVDDVDDVSDGYFEIQNGSEPSPASITVTYPNGGEVFDVGDPCTITWSSEGAVGSSVKIILYKDGVKLFTIVKATGNDGSYDWNIPGDITPRDDYQIRVKSVSDDPVDDMSDGEFTIQPQS